MKMNRIRILAYVMAASVLVILAATGRAKTLPLLIPFVVAHCDTENGPVIQAAKKALDTKNIDLVLIWIQKQDEDELRKAFEKTLAVRKLNPQAKDLADRYFFETLVRIHRAGEGAPYTGIKAGGEEEPAIAAADKALETGSVDALAEEVAHAAAEGIRKRFDAVIEKKQHMSKSVEAGREYVEAYVTFIHYVERVHNDIAGQGGEEHGH